MKGWSIFSHSVSMLLRNFQAAMQIFLVPTLLAYAVGIAAFVFGIQSELTPFGSGSSIPLEGGGSGSMLKMAVIVVVALVASVWGIVAWHRYILLEEMADGWLPRFNFPSIFKYILRLSQVFVIAAIALAIVAFVGGAFVSAGGYAGVAILVVFIACFGLFLLRLLLVLPAAAIGKPFGLNDALRATKGALPALLLLIVCYVILQFAVEFALSALAVAPILGMVLQFGFAFLLGVLNASILTTLYGHYVEGRPV